MITPDDHLILDHCGPWTLDAVLALPEETGQRVELVDGCLLESPRGDNPHQRALGRVATALHSACPPGLEALPGCNSSTARPDVPFSLVVDPTGGAPAAVLFELDGVEYRESSRSTGAVLKLERPFPVTIELSP